MKPTLLFIVGLSMSGKGWFWNNILSKIFNYKLISMTNRKMREGEQDGKDYHFRTEVDFEKTDFVTYLDVNKDIRKESDPKWLYGVSVQEFMAHTGKNIAYDVIEPKYVRQMMDWCKANNLDYDFKILLFVKDNELDSDSRANMKDDKTVRTNNTCDEQDFIDADLYPDWKIISSAEKNIYDVDMVNYFCDLAEKVNVVSRLEALKLLLSKDPVLIENSKNHLPF